MKRLIWSLRRIFIQFITHLTLSSYLLTIFTPVMASAGAFEISFEHLKEASRLVHNKEFEHQLGEVLQKRISEAKEVRAGAGALGGVAGYESDGDARSVDSGYVSDSTRSIMTPRKPRGGAGYESEDGYASDASELSRYGAGSERHLKATRGVHHKVQRVSFKYKKGDKEVWNTRTIFTGQESFKVMGEHGCLEFAIVDGQVHLKSFKGPELKVRSPRLGIYIDRHATILADRVSIASQMGVLNGRIEGGNVQWSGLEAEPYGSRTELMTALDSIKESAIKLGLNGRSLPLSSQVYGDSTLDWAYCIEKRSFRRVDPNKLYNGMTLEEYIKAHPPKKPQPQPLDLKIGSFGAMKAEDHIKLDNVGSITSSGYVHSDGDLHITSTNLENHGTMSGQGDVRVAATKIDNSRGTIRGQGHIEVRGQEIDNQDGKIEGKNLTVKTHTLSNERGKIGGANSTSVIMGQTDIPTPSTFRNLLGEIGAIGSKTILRFLTQAAVTTLGVIRGYKIRLLDESGSDTLTLQDGIIESMALMPEAGGVIQYGPVHIQAKRFHAPKVKFLVDTLYAKVTDLHLGTQDSLRRLVIKVPVTGSYNLTHPIRTAGVIEFWEEGFRREDEVREAMERIYGKDGLVEASATHTIHIDADVQAKDLRIFAPHALLRFGEQKDGKPTPIIDLQQGNLTTYVNTFDLENAFLAALNAFIHGPMGIRIGRLIRDKIRDNFATFYAHSQCSTSFGLHWFQSAVYNYMGKRLQDVFDGRQFVLRMPVTISNGATLDVSEKTTLKGPLRHQGALETGDLDLDSPKESVFEVAIARIKRNFTINGLRLLLSPIIGTLDLCYSHRDYEYKFIGSDPSELWVGGEIKTDSTPILKNLASILKARSIATSIGMEGEDFDSSIYQKFLQPNIYDLTPIPFQETCMATNGGYGGVSFFRRDVHGPRRFLQYTNNFAGAQQHFSYKTETDEAIILHPSLAKGRGHLSALAVLAFVGEEDFSLGSFNPGYTPPPLPSPIGNLMAKPFNHMSVNVLKDFTELMMGSAMRQSLFGFREFRHDEAKAQAFCAAIHDYQIVITPVGPMKRSGHAVYALSPKLLLERVQRECMDKLNRSNIYPGKPLNEDMLIEMHKNALECFEELPAGDQSMALVLRSKGAKIPKLTKPVIFYKEEVNEHGITVLTAFPVFPIHMIEEVHGKGSGYIFAQIVGIFPKSMSPMHLLEFFRDMPAIGRQVARILLPDAIVDPLEVAPAPLAETGATAETAMVPLMSSMLAARGGTGDMPTMPSTGGKTYIYADATADHIRAVVAGALGIHSARLEGKHTVLLASLNDMVSIITEKKRLGGGDRWWEVIDRRASIVAEQIYLHAGTDILLQGAETKSKYDTYMRALGNIFNVPVELLWKTIDSYRDKKGTVTEERSGTTHAVSSNIAGGTLTMHADDNIFLQALKMQAQEAYVQAGNMLQIADAQDMVTHSKSVSGKGGFWSRSIKSNTTSTSITSVGASINVDGNFYVRGQNIALTNSMIRATKTIADTIDGTGEVLIAMGKRIYTSTNSLLRSSTWWQTSKGGGESHQTYVPLAIEGEFEVNAARVTVQEKPGLPSFSSRIKLLKGEVLPYYLTDIHHAQAMSHTGPTSTTCALVAIGVGIATMGTLGPAVAGAMGAAQGGVTAAAISAGVSSMASQYAVNMASTRGDVGASAKALTTRESLRSTAVAMGTAGLSWGLGNAIGLQANPTGWQHLEHAAVHTTAGAASGIVIGGEDHRSALEYAARGMVASTIGGMAANEISGWYGANPDMYWGHKFAHFGLGGLMGAIQYGEDGILGGAIGGMAAEMAMEAMVDRDAVTHSAARKASESMERMPYEERMTIDPITKRALFYDAARSEVQTQRDFSHFIGAAVGAFAGGHVGAASLTATNAVDHNFIPALAFGAGLAAEEGLALLAGAGITYFSAKRLATSRTSKMDSSAEDIRWGDEGFIADPDAGKPKINSTPIPSRALQELILTTPIYTKSREALIETYPELEPEMRRLGMLEGFRAYDGLDMSIFESGRHNKQIRLRSLLNDDKIASSDRGWIRQEMNSIDRGDRTTIRVPIGKQLAHQRGFEAAKGYDYSYSHLQDIVLHKLQHRYDGMGKRNTDKGEK